MSDATTETSEPAYAYRPSVLGATWSFRLAAQTLDWDTGRRSGRVRYDRVTRVRLSFRPMSMQSHRFRAEIWSKDAPRLDVVSSTWKSMVEQTRLDGPYRDFILELHRRLRATGAPIEYEAGLGALRFWPGLAVFAATAFGLAWIAVRATQQGGPLTALLIVAFLVLFLWRVGNYFRFNRPRRYRPDALPRELLPKG